MALVGGADQALLQVGQLGLERPGGLLGLAGPAAQGLLGQLGASCPALGQHRTVDDLGLGRLAGAGAQRTRARRRQDDLVHADEQRDVDAQAAPQLVGHGEGEQGAGRRGVQGVEGQAPALGADQELRRIGGRPVHPAPVNTDVDDLGGGGEPLDAVDLERRGGGRDVGMHRRAAYAARRTARCGAR